jgi:hypothetical protein
MSKKYIILLFILVVLILLSSVYVVGGTQAYSRYRQSSLAQKEYCGGQAPVRVCVRTPPAIFSAFYPFYVATHYPLFKIDYSSSSPLTLLVNVSVVHFSQEQTQTVQADSSVQGITFIPPLQGQMLRNLTEDLNTSVHVRVTDTKGRTYYVNDVPLLLRSRWLMQWLVANRLLIAAWVTPDDPAVVELVGKAAKRLKQQSPPGGLVGYKGSPQLVIDQVDAIYDTLRLDYHMQYIPATVPYAGFARGGNGTGDEVTQYVKLPGEVLRQRSGMCIELTVLLAAAVEKIGLHAQIVIIPGHAFLGVSVTEDDKQVQYWDAVDMNNNVAADSANVAANSLYVKHLRQHTIVDTIVVRDARGARIRPMM